MLTVEFLPKTLFRLKPGKGKRTARKGLHAHFKKVFGYIFFEAKFFSHKSRTE